jgi:hypothetical protein
VNQRVNTWKTALALSRISSEFSAISTFARRACFAFCAQLSGFLYNDLGRGAKRTRVCVRVFYMRPVRKYTYTYRREPLVNYFRGRIMAKSSAFKRAGKAFLLCSKRCSGGFSGGGHANLCLPSRSLIPGSIFDFAPTPTVKA